MTPPAVPVTRLSAPAPIASRVVTEAPPADLDSAEESAEPPQRAGEERSRIRGDALRRSLFWTLLAWMPGAFWMAATSGGTPTILAKYLGATPFWIGAMTAAAYIAVALQIPGAMIVESLGRRKWFFIYAVTLHRVIYILIGLLPWILPKDRVFSAGVMILLILISMGLNNLGGQAWVNWMADLVPTRVRGKYFALRGRAGLAVMVVTSVLLGLALDAASTDYFGTLVRPVANWSGLSPLILLISVVFMVSGAVGMLDILAFAWVDEPPMRRSAEPIRQKLMRPLHDRQFMMFCGYWSIWTFAVSFGSVFWWLYILEYFKVMHDTLAAAGQTSWFDRHQYLMMFLMLPVGYWVGQFVGNPVWGKAVDRFGRKPVLFVSSTLHTATWCMWLFLSPSMLPWMPLVQFMGGLFGGGQDIGSFNIMLQYNRKGGSGYQALGSVIFSIAGFAGALISGELLGRLNGFEHILWAGTPWQYTCNRYSVMIVIAVLIKYLADLTVLPYVPDLASRPRRETARFVLQNMYGELNNALVQPFAIGLEMTTRTLGQVRDKVQDVAEVAGANFKRWFR